MFRLIKIEDLHKSGTIMYMGNEKERALATAWYAAKACKVELFASKMSKNVIRVFPPIIKDK